VILKLKVSITKKQHQIGVDLLRELGLDYIPLEPQRGGHYRYRAWNTPLIEHNGSPKTIKRGRVWARK
jgi:hypothetical protein